MNMADLPMSLLAASGGDTVKLFDVSVEPGDPCTLSYIPSPGSLVNSVKWNHTNLVVASGGEDKRISLWRKNGQSLGTIPVSGMDSGDNIEESIASISFSNKGSRYICSGGSSQVVRIWDLQRKRCIKWLKGHTSSITGVLYNCKDEHLASISLGGNLILHNLASGARAAELKDPNQQVLRVLDYSRISRHLLVTAGDDGSIHLWDTTGRNPKISWLKQHSAPTAGISFSPSNDKIIASVGLDKKLYTLDPGSRRSSSCISYEAPFSSLAFRDDGWTLAAGTSNGRVVFYDVRATPQPITILRAYSSSEAVTSLCWQRSKPVTVNENCSPETALLGGSAADSIVMPDPLPSVASSSTSLSSAPGSRNPSRSGLSMDASSLASTVSGSTASVPNLSSAEETPIRSHLWPSGTLTRLHPLRPGFNLKDDMDVFSPVVEVQPITPSLDKLLDEHGGFRKENLLLDKKPSTLLFPSSNRLFPLSEDSTNDHPIYDWKSSSTSGQDDNRSSLHQLGGSTPTLSSKIDDSSITPPEAWGGGKLPDRLANLRQPLNLPSRMGMVTSGALTSGSMFSTMHDAHSTVGQTSTSSLTNSTQLFPSLRIKDSLSNQYSSLAFAEQSSSISTSISVGAGGFLPSTNSEAPGPASLALPRRLSYAERISTTSSFSDGTSLSVGSPKIKKTGAETREELQSSLLPRSDITNLAETGILPTINGGTSKPLKAAQSELPQGNSFTLQLFQRTLEETLDSFQKSIHDDMRNLHIELIRQFHMQEMEFSAVMKSVLENQAELMKEVKSLRKENHELRQLL